MVAISEQLKGVRECTPRDQKDLKSVAHALFHIYGGTIMGDRDDLIRVVAKREIMVRNRDRNGRIVPITEVDYNISFYHERIVHDLQGEHLKKVLLGGSSGASPMGALTSLDARYRDPLIDHMHAKVQRFNSRAR